MRPVLTGACDHHENCDGAKRWGKTSAGSQRYRCRKCAATFTLGEFIAGGRLDEMTRERAEEMLNAGASIRATQRVTGVHPETLTGIRQWLRTEVYPDLIEEGDWSPPKCGCGRDPGHKGRCSHLRRAMTKGAHHKTPGGKRPKYRDPDNDDWSGQRGTSRYVAQESEGYECDQCADFGPFRSREALEWHLELRHR